MGTVRFHTLTDDGVRIYVDDQLILDAWSDHDAATLQGAAPRYPDGQGVYWSTRTLCGAPVLVRNDRGWGGTAGIEFSWGARAPAVGLPDDGFSARWTRKITFRAGTYRLYAWADDAIRVYVDGDLVIDEWHGGTDHVYSTDLALDGAATVRVAYAEHSGDARLRFWWTRLGDLPTPTPTTEPTPTPTAEPTAEPTPTPTAEPTAEPAPDDVRLNEVLPRPGTIDWDGDGTADARDEWIELYNASDLPVDLGGWWVATGAADGNLAHRLPPRTVLGAGEYLVLYLRETAIALDDDGAQVRLLDPASAVVDAVKVPGLDADTSYGRDAAGAWRVLPAPSPGMANDGEDWPPGDSEPAPGYRPRWLDLPG
jgi:hypothetical protein